MADLLRVSIQGAQPNGEVWSVNPVFRIGGDFGAPVSATQALTIATAIDAITISSGLTGIMNPATTFVGNRVEARSLAGILESQAEHVRPSPIAGTGGQAHPYQTSMVSSLRTGTPGPSGRGRLYWPATGIAIGSGILRPNSTAMNTAMLGVKTYLSAIQAAIDVTLDGVSLVVWSRKNLSTANVSSIQVGDVLDVQRRRRDTAIENYLAVTYP